MRDCEGAMKVYLGDVPIKPDVNLQMSSETFDAFCNKEINGFTAFVTGKLQFTGSLAKVKKWDNEIASKYMTQEFLDKDVCFLGLDK